MAGVLQLFRRKMFFTSLLSVFLFAAFSNAAPSNAIAQSASSEESWIYDAQKASWKTLPAFSAAKSQGIFSWTHLALREKELLFFAEVSGSCPQSEPECVARGIAAAFDPVHQTWEKRSGAGVPTGRKNTLAVQDGDSLLFFGGNEMNDQKVFSREGSIYSMSKDSWKKISAVGAPGIESPKGIAMGGGKIFIWGTAERKYPRSEGAIYDIESDSWKPVTAKDAPSASWVTLLVWTGDKILAWGPRSEFGCVGSGAQYDPVSDSWSSVASAGAPSACDEPLVFWDSGKMYVWGGRLSHKSSEKSAWTKAGGIFSAAQNRWSPITGEGAPELDPAANGLLGYRAAWNSGKLVIFHFGGGAEGNHNQEQCAGSIYSSQKDRWSPFRSPLAERPPTGAAVSYGFDRLQGEIVLYALQAEAGAKLADPESDNLGVSAFRFPSPPPVEAIPGFEVVRIDNESLVKIGDSYLFLKTVTRNSKPPNSQ